MSKSAIILLSGGLDSATVLALAKAKGYDCYAMNINYNQRHNAELIFAKRLAKLYEVKEYKVVNIGTESIIIICKCLRCSEYVIYFYWSTMKGV